MSDKKLSGYDVPIHVEMNLPSYHDRIALVKYYKGAPENWTPEHGLVSLRIEADKTRVMGPLYRDATAMAVTAANFAEALEESLWVAAGWADGDATQADAYLDALEVDREKATWMADLLGDPLEIIALDCGGGSYGVSVYVYANIAVAVDTESTAWAFTKDAIIEDVVGFAKKADDEL